MREHMNQLKFYCIVFHPAYKKQNLIRFGMRGFRPNLKVSIQYYALFIGWFKGVS